MLNKLKLNSNALKFIACISMFLDHLGVMIFPNVLWLRYVGRIAFPIFAFFIAEGCRHTKNKIKYFLSVFILGIICQAVYFFVAPYDLYFGILITFSFSILLIYALKYMQKSLSRSEEKLITKVLACALFFFSLAGVYAFCKVYSVDYGFMGCILPVFASLLDFKDIEKLKDYDRLYLRIIAFSIGIVIYFITSNLKELTFYALISIPLLFLYDGKRGNKKLKYFFYVFYPAHFIVLSIIKILL